MSSSSDSEYRQLEYADWEAFKRIGSVVLPLKYLDTYWLEMCSDNVMYYSLGIFINDELVAAIGVVRDAANSYNPEYMRPVERDLVTSSNKVAYISCLVVAENHRGKGYGQAILSRAMTKLEEDGVDVFYLHVRQVNEPARKLYEKVGFKRENVIKKYYTLNTGVEDADLYVRRLITAITKTCPNMCSIL